MGILLDLALANEITRALNDKLLGDNLTLNASLRQNLHETAITHPLETTTNRKTICKDFAIYLAILADGNAALRADNPFDLTINVEAAVDDNLPFYSRPTSDDRGP